MSKHHARKNILAGFIFTLLFSFLFQYRILSYLKKLGFDVTPIGTKFPVTFDFAHTPTWLLPIYRSLDYLNSVWSTTLLGFFIAGAFVTFLSGFARTALQGDGFKGHLWGTALGIPNMFCTCCAVSTVTGLRRAGAGLGPSLSFFVTAPTLNLVVILLAFTLLPLKFALARLILGLFAALFITWLVARLIPERKTGQPTPVIEEEDLPVPALLRLWLKNTWQIAVSVLPLLLLGIFLVSVLQTIFPMEALKGALNHGLLSTVLAAVVGTLLMVPTFTEVVLVAELVQAGAPAAPLVALLITLPAVSLPSLLVLGKNLKSSKVAVLLGFSVALLGITGGLIASLFF